MISELIDPPKTIQDRLRNAEWLAAGESPLYGEAADEIDRLLLKLETSSRLHDAECRHSEEMRKQLRTAESKLSALQTERDGAFALIYELMRDEHFIHGRDSWFKRAHELCGDICTPGIHAPTNLGENSSELVVETPMPDESCEHGKRMGELCEPCGDDDDTALV